MKEPLPAAKHAWLAVAWLFFKVGAISFGGPAAHTSLMEQETVRKRGWLSREHFLDLLAATNLVPGPNATEMAIHIGFLHAGWPGLIAGGVAFIVPAFLISLALAIVYVRLGSLPQGAALFYGINPAVMAIILAATYRLGRTALRDKRTVGIGVIGLAAALAGVNEFVVLLAAGLAGILLYAKPKGLRSPPVLLLMTWSPLALPLLPAVASLDDRLLLLGLFFLKVGALLFGSGMVLFAFIQRDVVSGFGWLTQQQLLDAIAVGQMTPRPGAVICDLYRLPGGRRTRCGRIHRRRLPAFLCYSRLDRPLDSAPADIASRTGVSARCECSRRGLDPSRKRYPLPLGYRGRMDGAHPIGGATCAAALQG